MTKQSKLDHWWRVMFAKMLDAEMSGRASPKTVESRWLVLNLHAGPTRRRPRWVIGFDIPEHISHFLDDADIRTKDAAYAQHQWAAAREWLNA
jgi:hypothetical protein